jgi:hypothetical protein
MKAFFIFFSLLIVSCNSNIEPTKEDISDTKVPLKNNADTEFSVVTIENQDATWGYQLLKDGKLMIDQKNIPAIQGNRGFSTKEKAELMGSFILQKVKNGGFPPTVSIEEMDSLGVLN